MTPDGRALAAPSAAELAAAVGLSTAPGRDFYDLVIVGGGPAGLGAAVYGASEGLHTVLAERKAIGGQAGQSSRIENYLGFPDGVSGAQLTERARRQAGRFEAEVLTTRDVVALTVQGGARVVRFDDGTELSAHAVIIATGVSYRPLVAPGVAGVPRSTLSQSAATVSVGSATTVSVPPPQLMDSATPSRALIVSAPDAPWKASWPGPPFIVDGAAPPMNVGSNGRMFRYPWSIASSFRRSRNGRSVNRVFDRA